MRPFSRLLILLSVLAMTCAASAQTGATFSYDASGNRTVRTLSPDPYVQAPDFTQNLNRYCYCLGNPLKYTDPEGEFIFSLFLGPIGASDAVGSNGIVGELTRAYAHGFTNGMISGVTGGDFWQGAAIGLMNAGLNLLQHQVENYKFFN